jgi:hypothetical protein
MKIFIRDISSIQVPSGPRVRFSVTFADEDANPLVTMNGWTMDRKRRVQTSAHRAAGGKWYRFDEASPEFLEKIKTALNGMKSVQEILGPEVEGVTWAGNATYDEEAEIV